VDPGAKLSEVAHPVVHLGPLRLPPSAATAGRAEIVLHDLDHSVPSFEARVFLNNPSADATTAPTPANGFAGKVHVYGAGYWLDQSPDFPRMRADRMLLATDAVRRAAAERPGDVLVSIVPVTYGAAAPSRAGAPLVSLRDVSIRTA
jgi:hypothetical protein